MVMDSSLLGSRVAVAVAVAGGRGAVSLKNIKTFRIQIPYHIQPNPKIENPETKETGCWKMTKPIVNKTDKTKSKKTVVKDTTKEVVVEEPKKKGSKLIPKPKLVVEESLFVGEYEKEYFGGSGSGGRGIICSEVEQNILPPPLEASILLPNVVVRLHCQLSDLDHSVSEEISTNPYEYKAWIPSEIKTYNTTEFQSGSLSMEPIHFIGMEHPMIGEFEVGGGSTEISMGKDMVKEDGKQVDDNYAYLDANWLHRMNKTPKQIVDEKEKEAFVVSEIMGKENVIGKKRDVDGGSVVATMESSEYLKAPISKDIQNKLHQQKVLLYHGLVQHQKKSACFWCTCDYDTPACAIPFYNVDGTLDSYGSFCRPECAVAYLYSEKLDDSVRADRDHLINFYYGKSYSYEKRIKPAPDPHYLLDKFFGNLTIQEYRKLLKSEHLLATLDKPMTRIFPELHEITDDFLIQIYGGDITLNRGYRVKRASEQVKGPSKMDILRDQFIPSKKPHHIRGGVVETQG
jgi:hypothetical protein